MKNPNNAGRRNVFAAAGVLCVVAMTGPGYAQETQPDGSASVFDAAFFAAFNPVTAEDMVRRVPGFSLSNGEERRGFAGASGNVLINGERPSSKAPISQQLARIAAEDVERIDLYAGGSAGGDIRGQTRYVDVRLRPRQRAQATNTFVAQASRLDPGGSINPLVTLNSGFRALGANANLSFQAQPSRRGRIEFDRTLRDAGGALLEQGNERLQGDYWEYKLNGRATWRLSERDTLTLNAEAAPSKDGRHTFSEVYDPLGDLIRTEDSKVVGENSFSGEIGGDWERKFSDGLSFKLIGLASSADRGSDERYSRVSFPSGTVRDTLITRASETGEYIGRGVLSWRAGESHSLEFAAEGAFNFRDSALDIEVRTSGVTIDATPPVANTRVEETRAEASLIDFWQVSDTMKLEVGAAIETSEIVQSGDALQERTFTFVKPRLRGTWDPEGPDQWRILLERDVAQLDFSEFASAVSFFDGTTDLGNPDLEPERTWRAQLDWERRFGPKGVIVVSVFHDEVEAVQDRIPIGAGDGPGNLGDGRRSGIKVEASAPLDEVGLAGGELRFSGVLQDTSVTDPVTGLDRRFSDEEEWRYSFDFRQPLPALKLAWGVAYADADATQAFLRRELRTNDFQDPRLNLFVETTAIDGLVVRLSLQNAFRPVEARERRFFDPDRSDPAFLDAVEQRLATGAYGTRSIALRVSGRF